MGRRKMWGRKKISAEINPEEIFIDSSNLPAFDKDQFEGRLERPISRRSIVAAGSIVAIIFALLVIRAGDLEIAHGQTYAKQAADNPLIQQVIFADRGIIVDRNGVLLAGNNRVNLTDDFAQRVYTPLQGLALVLGYAVPPAKDSSGVYFRDEFVGMDGIEKAYNQELAGQNGLKLTEANAHGGVVSEDVLQPPVPGKKITLSIDASVTQALYTAIADRVQKSGFQAGAGVVMDVTTGEILALTSYPQYSPQAMTNGDTAAISGYNADPRQPFLNRAVDGLYAPGSIVKPIIGVGALTEGVINENTQILSTGSISVPNPFDPKHPSIFKDWRANGWVDMRLAIAWSSDVYFYEVGGGYQNQPGIGISGIDTYMHLFGFGSPTGLAGFTEPSGTVPSPAWKAQNFPTDPTWRIGDTYHTTIGQYGVTITPLQAVREAAAIANGGTLMTPTLIASSTPEGKQLGVPLYNIQIIQQGMRLGVTSGISQAVKFDFVHVAGKTGTAQLGANNQYENSWMIGFFPYEHPRYAYAVVLEKAPTGTLIGAPVAVGNFLQWMETNTPQYLQNATST